MSAQPVRVGPGHERPAHRVPASKGDTMGSKDVQGRPAAGMVVPADRAREYLASLIEAKVEAQGDSDGGDAILAAVLSATGLDDLNGPWNNGASDPPFGVELKIDSFRLSQSDFQSGVGVFAIVEGVNLATGEPFVITTGAAAVVAQLCQAEALGVLPIKAVFLELPTKHKDRKPPQRLNVLDSYTVQA